MSEEALRGIGSFHPQDSRDLAAWHAVQAFVLRNGDRAFGRDTRPGGHVTGSGFVLSPDGTAAALIHHKKLDRWLQPGGHCDGQRDARGTALREVTEETGLEPALVTASVFDIDIHAIPARDAVPGHWHYDIRFLMRGHGRFRPSAEVAGAAWVPLADLTDSPLASLRRMARRALCHAA